MTPRHLGTLTPPSPLAPLFNLSTPLNPADHPTLLPAFTDPANQHYLEAHEQLRNYRIKLALDEALLTSIQTLVDVQKNSDNDADRRRAATVIVHLFKSNSRTPRAQHTQAAAGASPPPASPTAPSTPRHLDTSTPSSHTSTPSPSALCIPQSPAPRPDAPDEIDPSPTPIPGPPDPYNPASRPAILPPPPPDASPKDVVRTQLRAMRTFGRHPSTDKDAISAILNSLAPCLRSQGQDALSDLFRSPSNNALFFRGHRCTIHNPVERPISDRKDHQPTSPSDLRSATVTVNHHHCVGEAHSTFHLILHNPTTNHPLPPIWLTTLIENTKPDTS